MRPAHAAPAHPQKAWTQDEFQVPPAPGKTRFHDLHLPPEIMRAVSDLGFAYCTPIQALSLPPALTGKCVGGRAQTGTGKTAAFLITIFSRFLRNPDRTARGNGAPRALIVAPTRELVHQIQKDAMALNKYCGFQCLAIYGGMDYRKQQLQLAHRIDLVAATPGRLLDFKQRGLLNFQQVEVLVLDEADRMLDMGFIPDVRKIVYSLPPRHKRQTMLFSATLTQDILRLAAQWLVDPVMVESEPEQVTVAATEQRVYAVPARDRFALLYNLLRREPVERALVFRNRRDGVERLAGKLARYGVQCAELSGDVPQEKRFRIMEAFRAGKIKVVIATDVAGRGIHVEGISHVINYDVPFEAEDYVHRIGRTGRAGASGIAITFACEEGAFILPDIERFIGRSLSCIQPAEELLKLPEPPPQAPGAEKPAHAGHVERPRRYQQSRRPFRRR